MRILIATSHRNRVGGIEKYLQQILPGLIGRGHQLALLYEYRFDPRTERIDLPELDLPGCGIEESGVDAGLRFARAWKPDLVYSQGLERAGLQSVLLGEYPNVFYAHNYVGTCVSGEKCHAFPSPQPCDRHFGPACLALYYPRRCGGLNPVTMGKLYQRCTENNAQLQKYAAILVASAHMRREYERHGVPSERIHLTALPNPSESEQVDAPARTGAGGKLLFLGRLTKLKGCERLLEAIPLAEKKLLRRLTVTVAGDGPERRHLEDFAQQNGLKAAFAGWVDAGQKADLMEQADLLVVPSLWPEPFGLVGIEAGARGLPAVAYAVGGISDWLMPGYSGELAPGDPPTVEGLANAITRALSGPSHYAALSRGAREVSGRFTLDAHVSRLEDTLQSVLETSRGEETIHAQA
jgi:glycosyltransferase involved in cell wall biosynthesis